MNGANYGGERRGTCGPLPAAPQLVVLTGGPGAGKTAVLEFVRKILCHHVAILPEAASLLFKGGFWRLESDSAKKAAQRAIYYVQNEMQNMVLEEGKWSMGLCDRGTLDGLAYWPGGHQDFYRALGTVREKEYVKYTAVIHLDSPSLANGYNYQNPMRIESPELAAQIDQRIHEIWKDHPHYYRIESTQTFMDKINRACVQIQSLLPDCCKTGLRGP